MPWPDAEADEDGNKIPDFKELWFYYDLKFTEETPDGKKIEHKPPIALSRLGEKDVVQEAIDQFFSTEGKTDDEIREDKEMAKKLLPGRTVYLLGIDRSKEAEGPKMWSISSKKNYETVLKMLLDEKKGPKIMDTSPEGHDLEIEVLKDDQGRRQVASIGPAWDAQPLAENEELGQKWLEDMNFPDPHKIFARRRLTPEKLEEHFKKYMGLDTSLEEGTELETGSEESEAEAAEEVEEAPKAAKKKASKKAAKKSSKKEPENIKEAFNDAFGDDDDDDDE